MVAEWLTNRIDTALRGENPTVMRRLSASFAVIGDTQFLPGYCVLLPDEPGICGLTDLSRPKRIAFLSDMEMLAEAVERACGRGDPRFRRVNLEILGNTNPVMHAYVWPRYEWEPAERMTRPVWLYPTENWSDPRFALGPQHDELRAAITAELDQISAQT